MAYNLASKLGPRYISFVMVTTRLFGLVGGALVVYYVQLTAQMDDMVRFHWYLSATVVVLFSVVLTVLLALTETRSLRRVLKFLALGHPVPPGLARVACEEAITFSRRH